MKEELSGLRVLLGVLAMMIVVGFPALLRMIARSGKPAHEADGTFTLRHSILLRLFSLTVLLGGGMLFAAWSVLAPPQEADMRALFMVCLMLMLLFGFALLWESYRWRMTVTHDGIDCRSPWKARMTASWPEIRSVTYSAMNGWHVITVPAGSFRLPGIVPGGKRFLEECGRRIPDRL